MIGNIVKGRGFRGVLDYALLKEKGRLLSTNMASHDPRGLAKEFGAIRQLKPRLKNAVFHASLSAPKGQNTSDQMWLHIVSEYRKRMGFSKSQFVAVKHSDTEHDHVHFIASRIDMSGNVVSDSKDFERQEKALRAIEKQFGLVPLEAPRKSGRKGLKQGERGKSERAGELSDREAIQGFCDAAAELSRSFEEYVSQLKQFGVKVTLFTRDNKATLKGIVYQLGDFKIASGKLGRDYMPEGLAERGLAYEPTPAVEAELPGMLLEYMRPALDNFTRLKNLDPKQQEPLLRAWYLRDPNAAIAWCAGWSEGEDMGMIPTVPPQPPEGRGVTAPVQPKPRTDDGSYTLNP